MKSILLKQALELHGKPLKSGDVVALDDATAEWVINQGVGAEIHSLELAQKPSVAEIKMPEPARNHQAPVSLIANVEAGSHG